MHGLEQTIITLGRYPIFSLAEAREAAKRILAQEPLASTSHAASVSQPPWTTS
jgi:hypothetical protein